MKWLSRQKKGQIPCYRQQGKMGDFLKNYLINLLSAIAGISFINIGSFQVVGKCLFPNNPTKKIVDPPGVYTLSGVDEKKVSIFVKIKNETLIIKGFCFKNLMGPNLTIVECKATPGRPFPYMS